MSTWREFQFPIPGDKGDEGDNARPGVEKNHLCHHNHQVEELEDVVANGYRIPIWTDGTCQNLVAKHGMGVELFNEASSWMDKQFTLGAHPPDVMACFDRLEACWDRIRQAAQ